MVNGKFTQRCKFVVAQTNLQLVRQCCFMLESLLRTDDDTPPITDAKDLEAILIFALVWSVGACLVEADRKRFSDFLVKLSKKQQVEKGCTSQQLPGSKSSLYDFKFQTDGMKWVGWDSLVPDFTIPAEEKFYRILVPTA